MSDKVVDLTLPLISTGDLGQPARYTNIWRCGWVDEEEESADQEK